MRKTIHNGQFMRAEEIKSDCVAAVWDKAHGGGQIVDYVYLGEFRGIKPAAKDAETRGLKLRQNQILNFGPSVSIDGKDYSAPYVVHCYRA